MLSVIQRSAIGCVFPDVSEDYSVLIFTEKRSQWPTGFLTRSLVADVAGGKEAEGVSEQGVEENIWT